MAEVNPETLFAAANLLRRTLGHMWELPKDFKNDQLEKDIIKCLGPLTRCYAVTEWYDKKICAEMEK